MYLDTVKCIAIFLVVLGHCIQYFNGQGFDFFGDKVFKMIYSFHMPLFALVSGYLFYTSASRRTPGEILARQARLLLFPAFSWTLLYRLLKFCVKLNKGHFLGYDYLTSGLISNFLHSFWFLWSMFWCSLAVVIAERFFHGRILFYIFSVALSFFVPGTFNLYAFVYPYFVAGYFWHREGFDVKIKSLPLWLKISGSIAVISAWLIMLQYFGHDSYVYTTGISLMKYRQKIFMPYQFWTDVFRWAIGFAGSLSVMILLKLAKPVKILALIGSKTIGIYIISSYIINNIRPEHGGYIANFIEAVIITAICYALSMLISRNKLLNKLLLGGR